MAVTQRSIQQDIQGQMPVIPNNGNPGGAYNMPQQVASIAPQQQVQQNPLQWVEPSESMTNIRQLLADQADRLIQNISHPTTKGRFAPYVKDGEFFIMPLDDHDLPLSPEVPIVPMRTREEIEQYPDAPVIPQYLNPGA